MEQYIALHDYEKERADVLSFVEGDIFEVTSKTNLNWWAAHCMRTGEYGYVPRRYLEVCLYEPRDIHCIGDVHCVTIAIR